MLLLVNGQMTKTGLKMDILTKHNQIQGTQYSTKSKYYLQNKILIDIVTIIVTPGFLCMFKRIFSQNEGSVDPGK